MEHAWVREGWRAPGPQLGAGGGSHEDVPPCSAARRGGVGRLEGRHTLDGHYSTVAPSRDSALCCVPAAGASQAAPTASFAGLLTAGPSTTLDTTASALATTFAGEPKYCTQRRGKCRSGEIHGLLPGPALDARPSSGSAPCVSWSLAAWPQLGSALWRWLALVDAQGDGGLGGLLRSWEGLRLGSQSLEWVPHV